MSHPLSPVYAVQAISPAETVLVTENLFKDPLSTDKVLTTFDWGEVITRQIIVNGFILSHQTYRIRKPVNILFYSKSASGILQYVLQGKMTGTFLENKEIMHLHPDVYYLRFYSSEQQEWVELSPGDNVLLQLVLSPVLFTHVFQSVTGTALGDEQASSATIACFAPMSKKVKTLLIRTAEQVNRLLPDLLTLNVLGTLLTTQFIADSLRMNRRRDWEAKKQVRLEELQTYLEDHLDTDDRVLLRIAVLARKTGLSVHQFKKLFKQQYGQAPGPFIRSLRMNKAMQLLTVDKFAPGEIYTWVGFEDFAAFTKSFTTYYGKPPSFYKPRS